MAFQQRTVKRSVNNDIVISYGGGRSFPLSLCFLYERRGEAILRMSLTPFLVLLATRASYFSFHRRKSNKTFAESNETLLHGKYRRYEMSATLCLYMYK